MDGFEPVRVDELDDLEAGRSHAVALDDAGREALLVRIGGSEVVAFERACPHHGCPVFWSAAQWRFECPCHRGAFEAHSGAVVQGPPPRGLERIGLERREDGVWLIPGSSQRQAKTGCS